MVFDTKIMKKDGTGYAGYGKGDSCFYMIPDVYQEQVTREVVSLNSFLSEVQTLCPSVPAFRINARDLLFEKQEQYVRDFTFLVIHPRTETGRLPKYPYQLSFCTTRVYYGENGVNGSIYYLNDNTVGKATLLCYTGRYETHKVEQGLVESGLDSIYVVDLGIKKENTLKILRVVRLDSGKKAYLYKAVDL